MRLESKPHHPVDIMLHGVLWLAVKTWPPRQCKSSSTNYIYIYQCWGTMFTWSVWQRKSCSYQPTQQELWRKTSKPMLRILPRPMGSYNYIQYSSWSRLWLGCQRSWVRYALCVLSSCAVTLAQNGVERDNFHCAIILRSWQTSGAPLAMFFANCDARIVTSASWRAAMRGLYPKWYFRCKSIYIYTIVFGVLGGASLKAGMIKRSHAIS